MRADLLRPPLHRGDVLELGGLEEHVADRDEQRALVDRLQQRVQVGHDLDLRVRLRLEQVAHRRELSLQVDDPVSGRDRLKAGEDHGDRHGDVLVHAGRPGRRPDDTSDLVAGRERQVPPAFAPGADPASPPHAGVLDDAVLGRGRHRREGVVDQVRGVGEDREAVPVVGHVHAASIGPADRVLERRSLSEGLAHKARAADTC